MSLFGEWRDDIRCVFQRDPAARTRFEVLTTYPGVHAILLYRLAHRLWRAEWRYPARLLSFLARLVSNVDIHPGAVIGPRFFIDHGAGVVIGETAEIGADVTLYHGVTLGGTSWRKGKRHPTLGDGVLVGAGAKILGPISIGAGARVGANSVVVQDVPEGCTVVGIPGKVVRLREAGQPNPYGIDLDHHLIPDPVGKAIACLLERLDSLEKQVEAGGRVAAGSQQQYYQGCSVDNSICESDCAGGAVALGQALPLRLAASPAGD
ncbi:MAG TPA: serine O-acetyltransferase [Pseudomonas sp.]